jgi:hypothetical protein
MNSRERRRIRYWWARQDSNLRPNRYERYGRKFKYNDVYEQVRQCPLDQLLTQRDINSRVLQ